MTQSIIILNENIVYIQTAQIIYQDSFANFLLDSKTNLPDGIVSLNYNKNTKDCWINGQAFQPFPNKYAESILANILEIVDAQRKRTEPIPTEPTPEEIQAQLAKKVQQYLDITAKKLGYDSCLSVCSYINTGVIKFDEEGEAFRKWRSAVWAKGYEIVDAVKAGTSEIPTEEELFAELPVIELDREELKEATSILAKVGI